MFRDKEALVPQKEALVPPKEALVPQKESLVPQKEALVPLLHQQWEKKAFCVRSTKFVSRRMQHFMTPWLHVQNTTYKRLQTIEASKERYNSTNKILHTTGN